MSKIRLSVLAVASLLSAAHETTAQYAASVAGYVTGSLPANVSHYTNSAAVLGEPARVTPGAFGGPVDPFDPPYLDSQLLALGTNGSLTVQFAAPIEHNTNNPFGLDFLIFGSAAFTITNGDYSGGGITDGTLFSNNKGRVRVSVSADNTNYFQLDPSQTPALDDLFPSDGSGDFTRPVNPALGNADFAGQGLARIRRLYAGSGGGCGYALNWAQDAAGHAVAASSIQFIRVEVLDGYVEIAGFAAVAPVSGQSGAPDSTTIVEDFATDPAGHAWQTFGTASLFHWNPTNQNLEVTWDSSQPNSYFYRPLGYPLTKTDDFSLEFDLHPERILAGVSAGKPNAFELALGFVNLADATAPSLQRGTAKNSPNLVEFDYFPDTGYGATISPVVVSTNDRFFPSFSFPLELTAGDNFHVRLQYLAGALKLATTMTRNGAPFGPIQDVALPSDFGDFNVDAASISSYSDAGADGSLLAQGTVDNVALTVPGPPVGKLANQFSRGTFAVSFQCRSNWLYTLETTTDFQSWTPATPATLSQSDRLVLSNAGSVTNQAFFRVKAQRP
jgi:hypothetical protein